MTNESSFKSFVKVLLRHLITFFQGVAMGMANVVPGVSGGTVVLLMGIYDRFIKNVSSVSIWLTSLIPFLPGNVEKPKDLFRKIDLNWIISLFLGRGLAVIFASVSMNFFIRNYPSQTYGAFFGLVIASAVILFFKINKFGFLEIFSISIGFVLLFGFSGCSAVYVDHSPPLWLIMSGGILATSAMMLPGVSGSFVLLMLGIHPFIIGIPSKILKGELFTPFVCTPLIVYAIGWLVGLLSFSRLLKFLLKHHYNITMSFLIGLMLGSLRRVYPFLDTFGPHSDLDIDKIPKLIFWDMPENINLFNYMSGWNFISTVVSIIVGIFIISILHNVTSKHFESGSI